MQKDFITKETYDIMCYTNRSQITGEIRGIATDFHGYCSTDMRRSPKEMDNILAEKGIVTLYPFYGPWAWSNDTAVATIDALIELTYEMNGLDPEKIPLVITGKSMGGMTALAYTHYSRFKPVACAADCPVTDFLKLVEMRPDIYRAAVDAFGHYSCSLKEAMRSVSPMELAPRMPKIPYYIVAGTNDAEVDYTAHSERYVPLMRKLGYDVEYRLIEGMEHCEMSKEEFEAFCGFIAGKIEENIK